MTGGHVTRRSGRYHSCIWRGAGPITPCVCFRLISAACFKSVSSNSCAFFCDALVDVLFVSCDEGLVSDVTIKRNQLLRLCFTAAAEPFQLSTEKI